MTKNSRMAQRFRRAGLAIILLSAAGAFLSGCSESPPAAEQPAESAAAKPQSANSPFGAYTSAKGESFDLSQGEHLVAFLSMSCDHCQAAVPQLELLHDALAPEVPVVGLCLGSEEALGEFRALTGATIPLIRLEPIEFFSFIGDAPPRFVFVREGEVRKTWDETPPTLEAFFEAL